MSLKFAFDLNFEVQKNELSKAIILHSVRNLIGSLQCEYIYIYIIPISAIQAERNYIFNFSSFRYAHE